VLFRRTRHADAAWQLAEYLSRPAVQARFYGITGDLPPRRSSWREGDIASDRYIAAFGTQLERLQPFPQLPEWEEIMQAMRVMAERVATGTQGIDDATRQFDVEVNDMLAKRRWMLERAARRGAATALAPAGAAPTGAAGASGAGGGAP
jgi:multiple sugar transport system substrate-binding protein